MCQAKVNSYNVLDGDREMWTNSAYFRILLTLTSLVLFVWGYNYFQYMHSTDKCKACVTMFRSVNILPH